MSLPTPKRKGFYVQYPTYKKTMTELLALLANIEHNKTIFKMKNIILIVKN